MYPFGLFESILAIYGSYKLLDEFVFSSKKKVEYIELTDYQYQQVRNIINNDENRNEVCPPYTENNIVSNSNNNLQTNTDINTPNENSINESSTLLERQREEELQNKLAAPFH